MNTYKTFDTLQEFNLVNSEWESSLDQYSQAQLNYKPSPSDWSIGQVYIHILDAGLLYMLKKVERCLIEIENLDKGLSSYGKRLFEENSFPEIEIKIPGSEKNQPLNPESKNEISDRLSSLKSAMVEMDQKLKVNPSSGKSPHRFFDYLDAYEWFHLIPIHMRHHLRQKTKLENLINVGNI